MDQDPRKPRALTRRGVLSGGAALAASLPLLGMTPTAAATGDKPFSVLVFSRTTGFRHLSIECGVTAMKEIGREHGFGVEATEDPTVFTTENLRRFGAVVFLNTTGTVLDTVEQRRAFEQYVRAGGGYVGIHSASDTEYDWPFYGDLVGAYFKCHPVQQLGSFDNEAPDHPATAHLADRFSVFDEFYSFRSNPRDDVRVLLSIDESTYLADPNTTHLPSEDNPLGGLTGGETGYMGDHPMSWVHNRLGGTAFYTALGHEHYLYGLDWFRQHLLGGVLVATRQMRA